MGNDRIRAVKAGGVVAAVLAAMVTVAVDAHADDECLVQFEKQEGGQASLLADASQVCAVASGTSCTFQLGLCVDTKEAGCTAATFKAKKFKAKGHCAKAIGKVSVSPSASSSTCGSFTGITVKTKKKGTLQRTCTNSASVKSDKTSGKRRDKDTITLVCMPSTGSCPTTTTTTPPTTTSTTLAPPSSSLSFTTSVGTTDCGGAGLASPPAAPASGEIDSDVAGTTKISDLGLGCLYFGGGMATVVPPGRIPDGAASFLAITGAGTLGASPGTGFNSCTQGLNMASKHCINNNSTPACTTDTDCGGSAGSCGADARCAFGPPLPILSPPPFGALTTCVVNVVSTDASGTFDTATGNSSVSLPLVSRVYITTNTASPCPKCAPTCTYGKNAGGACAPVGSLMTSNDCLPALTGFQAPLGVDLTPLTSGATSKTAADGLFCPGQINAGAFGKSAAQRIAENGMPAGNLGDNMPHPSILSSVFCIPATGNTAVDGVSDLPGPGAIGLNGVAQIH